MADTPTKIEVTSAQGVTDALQAAIRYSVVVAGFVTGLLPLLGPANAADAVAYVQTNLGAAVSAIFGLVALGTAAYGIYKTYKRGAQVATVAESPAVPNALAQIKDDSK